MNNMNSKQIVMTVGVLLILSGLVGLIGTSETSLDTQNKESSNQTTLEVKRGNNLPTSTIDYVQGSGNLQGQGTQPQSSNAGGQLHPNAGADSLPDNY